MRRRVAWAVLAALTSPAGLAGAGCSSEIEHPPYAPQPPTALVEVVSPPPPGRVEIVPPRPIRPAVWIDGEWSWRRRRWAWLPGRWVQTPADAKFSPWVFVRGVDGRFWYAPGGWHDKKGGDVIAPPVLAEAHADSSEVVNASGLAESTGATIKAPAADAGADAASSRAREL